MAKHCKECGMQLSGMSIMPIEEQRKKDAEVERLKAERQQWQEIAAMHATHESEARAEIERLRTELSDFETMVADVDTALLKTGIVPTTNEQHPNGMGRVECIAYMASEIERRKRQAQRQVEAMQAQLDTTRSVRNALAAIVEAVREYMDTEPGTVECKTAETTMTNAIDAAAKLMEGGE